MANIQALRQERDRKAGKARQILDDNKEEWTDDLQGEIDTLYAEIDKIDAAIKREKDQLDLEARLALQASDPDTPARRNPVATDIDPQGAESEVHRTVFDAFLRGGERAVARLDETVLAEFSRTVRAEQSTGIDSEGGHLVPRDFAGTLLQALKDFGGVRNVASVLQTSHGRPIDWPTVDETSAIGELVAENQPASDGDIVFGTTSLQAHKYSSTVITVPRALLQDAQIGDLEGEINAMLTTRLGRITNQHFTTGDNANKPQGIVNAASVGRVGVAGQVDSFIYDDLVELEHAVDPAYRRMGAGWMFHDDTLKAAKLLKDADGRPLWRPGLTGGDPADLMGYSYEINQDMAPMAAGARSILFGAFQMYKVRDVMEVTLFRFTDSAYTKRGQVGFLAWMRTDGRVIDASDKAIKFYQNAAA